MRFGCGRAAAHIIYNPQGIYFSHIFAKKEPMEEPKYDRMPRTRRNRRLKRVRKAAERKMNRSEARYRVAKALGSKGAAGKHMKRIDKAAAKAMEKEKKIKEKELKAFAKVLQKIKTKKNKNRKSSSLDSDSS